MLLYGYRRLIVIGAILFLSIWRLSTFIHSLIGIVVYILRIIYILRKSHQLDLARSHERSRQFSHYQNVDRNHSNSNDYYNLKETYDKVNDELRNSEKFGSTKPKCSFNNIRYKVSALEYVLRMILTAKRKTVKIAHPDNFKSSLSIDRCEFIYSLPDKEKAKTDLRGISTVTAALKETGKRSLREVNEPKNSKRRRLMDKMQTNSSINQFAKQKSPKNVEKICESNSSMTIPKTLKKGVSYRRNLPLYTSLQANIQIASIPAHFPTLEEHHKDRKMEEKRLEWLLSAVKEACEMKDRRKKNAPTEIATNTAITTTSFSIANSVLFCDFYY
ncbi:uncharacterized protein LOC111642234 [Centruroides sculpturatus]|uniref:uncharacterized protein LOC111642234 n=1 Tax=Centruroides sculpturatus TaxID=218467 RepID=UPI000C6C9C9C|nr:uncharacterized protein LOC111642234 [Centruroides sculpturatus]XP_023244313.1 uncharacterized protein LOC111642234 [Centruroides sculpturatus]